MSSILPLVVEQAPIGILLVDENGKIVHLNPAGEGIIGYRLEEIAGQPMELLMPERFRKNHEALRGGFMAAPQARRMGKERYFYALHKEGREIPLEIGLVPLKTPKGTFVLATLLDVTARVENKQLEQDLLHVIELEQKRIGQDLHDSLGQQLLAISLLCNVLKKKVASGVMPEVSEAHHIEELVGEAKKNVRKLTRGLYAGDLESRGLGACIKEMTDHMQEITSIACIFEGDSGLVLNDRSKSENLFRLAQEALNNAIRHSQGDRIEVLLQVDSGTLVLSVRDNGVGFSDAVSQMKGLGLRSMRYRATSIGGTFEIGAHPEGGTLVRCSVPLP